MEKGIRHKTRVSFLPTTFVGSIFRYNEYLGCYARHTGSTFISSYCVCYYCPILKKIGYK